MDKKGSKIQIIMHLIVIVRFEYFFFKINFLSSTSFGSYFTIIYFMISIPAFAFSSSIAYLNCVRF